MLSASTSTTDELLHLFGRAELLSLRGRKARAVPGCVSSAVECHASKTNSRLLASAAFALVSAAWSDHRHCSSSSSRSSTLRRGRKLRNRSSLRAVPDSLEGVPDVLDASDTEGSETARVVEQTETSENPWRWGTAGAKFLIGQRPSVRYPFQIPQTLAPEIVLVGRSNAGKSTLLNEVLKHYGEEKMAQVSKKAGRTRNLTWFPVNFKQAVGWERNGQRIDDDPEVEVQAQDLDGTGCCLVDCFGLGEVEYENLKAKRLQSWGPLLRKYVSKRKSLGTVCHLISSEQGGSLSAGDEQVLQIVGQASAERANLGLKACELVLVLTKADLCSDDELQNLSAKLQEEFKKRDQIPARIIACSSLEEEGRGVQDFLDVVDTASRRGWNDIRDWIDEVNAPPGKLPERRSFEEQKQAKVAFAKSRQLLGGSNEKRETKPGVDAPRSYTELPPSI
eukprot:TRINITY_DN25298_c0_g4_i1.p1 TRINITY_DN25298_c0_g4~~TRINITY_DN25298_c0_g4_i1.p1  ORF type:complete len:462 (-),score=85.77 TRINITY_DN25298_c0_g4_i1:120-1469(-)